MSKTEPTPARGGGGTSPLSDLKSEVTGFVSEIKGLHKDFDERLQQTEERLIMLDKKSRTSAPMRPALSVTAETELPHQKAFDAYLRNGDDDALRGLALEGKAMSTSVAGEGGYLVDPQTSETVRGVLNSTASLRAVANVVEVEATSYDVLVDHSDVGHGWSTESGPVNESSTPVIDRISIPLHELSAMPKASQRLLDDSAFDVEGWLAGRIADKFTRAEAAAFIAGDGVDKPTGFLTHAQVDNDVWNWGNLGYVPTGADGAFDGPDAIIDLIYALGAQYRAGAVFVMNSKTAGHIRKMKDAEGRFLWTDGMAAGEPARLMGYKVLIAEDMPDVASGAVAVAFGDFGSGYTVAERPDLRVLRDPFSAKPHVLFYATKRVGGDVSDFAAIKLLKFAVA